MQYRPSTVVPRDWDRVKDFARQAVLDSGPSNATVGLRMLSVVTHYILWAVNEERAPLNRTELFHPTLLGRYIRMRSPNKQASLHKTLHSLLFRVASAVADVDHNRKNRGRISHGVVPYTAAELAEIESWATARKNAVHRRYAKTFLALAGGAGLQSVECAHVRGRDIVRTATGYSVRVTGRYPRIVPIQTEWATYIDDVIDSFEADRHVLFPSVADDTRPRTLTWFCVGEHPAPFAQRLRDTWVLSQLPVLPLGVLMQAAGMPDIQTLRRYLPRVAPADLTDWDAVLRQPSAHMRPTALDRERATSHRKLRRDIEGQNRPLAPHDLANTALRRADVALHLDQTAVPAGSAQSSVPRTAEHVHTERCSIAALEADWMPKRFRAEVPRNKRRSASRYMPAAAPDSATFTELREQLQERRDKQDGGDAR